MTPESFAMVYRSVQPAIVVLPRLLPILLIVPVFSSTVLPGLVRNGVLAIVALFISPSFDMASLASLPPLMWVILVAKEALIGILLAFGFSAVLWAIAAAGALIDFQTGSGNAAFFDPIAEHEGGPTSGFLNLLAITLFVSGDGLNLLLGALFESYKLWPIPSFTPRFEEALLPFLEHSVTSIMSWTVRLAAPVVIVLVLVEFGLGLIGRAMPQLNVFVMSQPVKSALAVLMMALFLSFVYASLHGYLGPDNDLFGILRMML